MIRATKSNAFSVSISLIDNNAPVSGATVNYEIRNAADDSLLASGTLTESANEAGIYYANPTIDTSGDYRAYISSAGYAPITEDIQVTEEESNINAIASDVTLLIKCIKNKKELKKAGAVWQLIIYDDNGIDEILNKDLKDKDGSNITDIQAGALAQELASSV
ncbi:MAG TPA: hypothetical protein ENH31_00345 [Nitrospirae bacterium]|nr:hypothetical protein [Nitrospirota bacterium]HDK17144.1 hypothetical protein [Nitrospirota bacterium]HDK81001.1 hypothetical protein [Nitrospirota bacterium]